MEKPGFPEISEASGGYFNFMRIMKKYVNNQGLKGRKYTYRDWMEAILSFDSLPTPASGPPSFAYFIESIRREVANGIGRRFEQEHEDRKRGLAPDDGQERITIEDIEAYWGLEPGEGEEHASMSTFSSPVTPPGTPSRHLPWS